MKSWNEYIAASPLTESLEEQYIPAMKQDFDQKQLKKIGIALAKNSLSAQKAVFKELPDTRYQWNADAGYFDRLANGVRGVCVAKVHWTRFGSELDDISFDDFAVIRINTKKDVELLGAGKYELVRRLMLDAPSRVIMKNFDIKKIYWIPADAKAEAAISDEQKEIRKANNNFKDPLIALSAGRMDKVIKQRAEDKKKGVGGTKIKTPFYGPVAEEILSSVLGQLSDGWGENSPAYNKYWEFCHIDMEPNGHVVIDIDNRRDDYLDRDGDFRHRWGHRYIPNGFGGKTEEEVYKFFAGKIKKTVQMELNDNGIKDGWKRDNKMTLDYLGARRTPVTVAQAYCVYETLLGRATAGKYDQDTLKSVLGH